MRIAFLNRGGRRENHLCTATCANLRAATKFSQLRHRVGRRPVGWLWSEHGLTKDGRTNRRSQRKQSIAILLCFICFLLFNFFDFYPCFIGVPSLALLWLR